VDGDGLADLLLPEFSAYLLYAPFADEIDTSRTPRSAEFPWDVRGASAAAPGDVDGGGRPDLLVSQGNTAALYRTEQ
jgi:hypothetical protein